jgi:hypothetical protein
MTPASDERAAMDLERLATITPGVTTQLQVSASASHRQKVSKQPLTNITSCFLCLQDFCSLALETIKVCWCFCSCKY